jgi:hypothetical protein
MFDPIEGSMRKMKMFWSKKSGNEEGKLSGPESMPELVQKYLVSEWKMNPDLVKFLSVVKYKNTTGMAFNIRVFDISEAIARKVEVKDYTSLDPFPDLILYEGVFNEKEKQVKLEERTKVNWDTPIFTEDEIQKKIESLKEPGNTTFFYTARGGNHGGPLGMGAAVIELNPNYPGQKQKKYNVYSVDVVNMQPANKGEKVFDFDKPNKIATWVKNLHEKRLYSS